MFRAWCLQQFGEERPVVDERLAQLFCIRMIRAIRLQKRARSAVVLNDICMVDRQIGDPLVEILDRIAARYHHGFDQHLRLVRGRTRIIDEAGLDSPP